MAERYGAPYRFKKPSTRVTSTGEQVPEGLRNLWRPRMDGVALNHMMARFA